VRRHSDQLSDRPELPRRAVGIVLGVWVAVFLFLGLVGVPLLFSVCGIVF